MSSVESVRRILSCWALLLRSQLRFARRTPFSSAAALLGLTLGIASVVAVHQICEQIVRSLDALVPTHLQGVSHQLTREELSAADYFALRQQWRAGALPGVRAVAPYLEGRLASDDGLLWISGVDALALPLAAEVSDDESRGAAPLPGDLVFATGLGPRRVGEQLTVRGRALELAAYGTEEGDARLVMDIALAHDLLAPAGSTRLSAVLLSVHDPAAPVRRALSRFLPGFEAGLPPPAAPPLEGWQVQAIGSAWPEQRFGRSVLFNLGALGTLSILVAWFLMYQTALLWYRRQQPVFDLLRAQGLPERWLLGTFAQLLVLLSIAAALAGVLLGMLLARWLLGLVSADSVNGWLPVSPALMLKVGLTVIAVPAVSVLLVLRLTRQQSFGLLWRSVFAALLAGLALWLAGWQEGGLIGGFGAILTGCALLVVLLLPVLELLRRRSWAGLDLHLRMGLRELLWHPRDLAAALAALSLAVATSIGIATMVDSFRTDFSRMLDQRLADGVRVEGDAQRLRAFARAFQPRAAERLVTYERAATSVGGIALTLERSLLDAAGAARFGLARALGPDQLLLSEAAARALELGPGDRLTLAGQPLVVSGIYAGYGDSRPTAQIDQAAGPFIDALGAPLEFEPYRLGLRGAQDPTASAEKLAGRWPALQIAAAASVRARAIAIFDQTFAVTRALTAVALLVAAVGLYSALTALGLTQSRSRRLLEYLGQHRRERARFAVGRAFGATLVTMLLAVPLGCFIAYLLCSVINPRGFGWSVPLAFSAPALLTPLGWSFLAALLAGLLGDRREYR